MPTGIKGVLSAVVGAGVVLLLPRLRAGRPARGRDQERAEEPAAGDHHRGRHRHRHLHPASGRVHRRDGPVRADLQPRLDRPGLPGHRHLQRERRHHQLRPVRRPRRHHRPVLAGVHPPARRDHLPVRHRPDLPDLGLPGQLRPGQEPVLPADPHQDRQPGRAVGQPDPRRSSAACVFLLPFPSWHALVGLVTGASVLMYAGAPLSLAAFRRPGAGRRPALPARRRVVWPRSGSSSPTSSSTGPASRWSGSSASASSSATSSSASA